MIDTLHFRCLRRLKAHVVAELKRCGYYEDEVWTISVETKIDPKHKGKRIERLTLWPKDRTRKKALSAFGEQWRVENVRVQLPCMLHGSNGFMLLSQEELDQAMENTFKEFDSIAERGVPWTDTSRLDVVMNLDMCPTEVLGIMKNVRVFGLHSWPTVFEDADRPIIERSDPQTVQWHDSRKREHVLSFYNKSRKEAKKSGAKDPIQGCLRVEYRMLNKKRIAKFLGKKTGGAMVNFDYLALYRSMRAVLCTLPPASTIKTPCSFETLLAVNATQGTVVFGVPVMDWYRSSVGERTFGRKAKTIASLSLGQIGLSWKDILPLIGPPEMVHVTLRGKLIPVFHPTWGMRQRIVRGEIAYHLLDV